MGWSSPSITDFSSPTDDAVSTPTMRVSTPLYDADAFSTPTFWGAGGGGGDAFEAAVLAEASLYGFWSCRDVPVAGIANLGTVMTDISGNGRPDIEARLAADNNWEIQTGGGAPGTVASLANYVATVVAGAQGTTNYAGLASTIAPIPTTITPCSGFVIYLMPSYWFRFEIVQYQGTAATPTGAAGPLMINTFGANGVETVRSDGGTNFNPGSSGSTGTGGNLERAGAWAFLGWRQVDAGGGFIDQSYTYVQQLGSAWGVNQTPYKAVPPGMPAWPSDGLRMAYGSSAGAAVLNSAWAVHGIFSSDIGEAGLQTIYEAIS